MDPISASFSTQKKSLQTYTTVLKKGFSTNMEPNFNILKPSDFVQVSVNKTGRNSDC